MLDLLNLAAEAATFRSAAFLALLHAPDMALMALWIPFLAGISELTGQGYILAVRRVSRGRALFSLLLTGLVHLLSVATWAGACFLFLEIDRINPVSPAVLLGVISLGYAPRVLGILTIAPFYGEILGRMLDAWAMSCVAWGVWTVTQGAVGPVIACAFLGWLVSLALRHLGGRLLTPVLRVTGLAVAGMRDV